MNDNNFGVGSTIRGHDVDDQYMVVSITDNDNVVYLINMYHMYLLPTTKTFVIDKNWLTVKEARELVNHLSGAFSDYTLDPAGVKRFND